MRIRTVVLSFFLVAFIAHAYSQSPVQRTIAVLDSLSAVVLDDWKMSPNLASYVPSGDPASATFDDAAWESLALNKSVYPDSCWLRTVVTLPKTVLGKPLSGPVRFVVSVDDYGYLWVDGTSLGHFPWNGDFIITESGLPGQTLVLAIKAINTGGPLRLIRAEIQAGLSEQTRRSIDDVKLSLRIGEKLLSFDTYQTNARVRTDPGIDRSTIPAAERTRLSEILQRSVSSLDIRALEKGPEEDFQRSVQAWRERVKPVSEFAKRFSIQFTSNAHIDAAWLWREKETIEVCNNTFNSAMNIMDARPDATFAQSSAAFYKWMEELYPKTFDRIKKHIATGRWEVTGGMWVEPDCNLPSGDSWMRHLLYAKRYFKQKLGVDVVLGWNPDSFGYNANMPMLYRQAGIDAFITQKIGWNDTNVFPHRLFWWESGDGSRILSLFPFDYVNTIDNPFQIVDWARQFEANTGFRSMLLLFGIGNHGGGPSMEMMKRIDRLKELAIYPSVSFGSASGYIEWLKAQDLSNIPVWNDELYLEYHRGTYTTQAAMKKYNRTSEALLTGAETFSSFAAISGKKYPSSSLAAAWEKVLFNQFHDILPGSSIREVYIDADKTHRAAQEEGRWELQQSLNHIAGQINTTRLPSGAPIVVFNQLSWPRTDLAHFELPKGDTSAYAVFTSAGAEIPSQMRRVGSLTNEIFFEAKDVPAMGYASYVLRKQRPATFRTLLDVSMTQLENDRIHVALDTATGWITSIKEKTTGREVLSGPGNELQILEDRPKAWDAWNIGLTGAKYPSKLRAVEIVERGPVRVTVRLHRTYLKPGVKKEFPTEDFPSSFFTQDISLTAGSNRVEFTTHVDWWEEKTMLKVAFPVTVQDSLATYEIPFGTIERSTRNETSYEKAQFEISSHRWAGVAEDGLSINVLNRSKYGYDIKGNVMRLSLLRSPIWPDPTADRGSHTIEYALSLTPANEDVGRNVREGYSYNTPFRVIETGRHKGSLGSAHSFLGVSSPDVIVTSVKKAEASSDWIVTAYNVTSNEINARLQFGSNVRDAFLSDILETRGEKLLTRGGAVEVIVKGRGMAVVAVGREALRR